MTEVWKDIKGFEGLYQVSNMGRVKSLKRLVERFMPHWGTTSNYVQPEKIRKLAATRGGYLFLPLCKDGVNYPKRVNRLVAEAFIEDYSDDKEVHHIDGDITNNRADNLKCLSSKEHHQKHPGVSVIGTNGENTIIARLANVGRYGFDMANVARCCKAAELEDDHPRKSKYATHKGYKWRYYTQEVAK